MSRKSCHASWLAICLLCITLLLPNYRPIVYAASIAAPTNSGNHTFKTISNSAALSASTGITVTTGISGQLSISITTPGLTVTLPDIQLALGNLNTNPPYPIRCGSGNLLSNVGDVWELNANLFIGPNVTLNLGNASGSAEVKLCSQASGQNIKALPAKVIQPQDASDTTTVTIHPDYASFVNLHTYNGKINIDHAKIYSWDPNTQDFDKNPDNGRAYILAKYNAVMNIRYSDISYLGSDDGESYGLAWRDIGETSPGVPRTRVTGQVIHNDIHHNYYGIYTFQAYSMTFSYNDFHNNIGYGFDPHDYTHHVIVDNNHSFNNGRHGFIISRGCHDFIFTNNESYNNFNFDPTVQAQGFMLDPGGDGTVKASSYNNTFSQNIAHDNEGFGLRILGSSNNQVLDNRFYLNKQGLVLDTNSTGNTIYSNTLDLNTSYGLVTQDTADSNKIISNTVKVNGNTGIYLHSSGNIISGNIISQNSKAGIALAPPTGTSITGNQLISNVITGNLDNGIDLRGAVLNTSASGNQMDSNQGYGVYLLNGPTQNAFTRNIMHANGKFGILASGAATQNNRWSENQIYANLSGGIALSGGANANIMPPSGLSITNGTLTGIAGAGSTVEIFSDNKNQAQYFIDRVTPNPTGNFSFILPANLPAANLTALLFDSQNNASILSQVVAVPTTPTVTSVPSATPTITSLPTATNIPGATATATPLPTATATPLPTATATPLPTATSTATSIPGATATATPLPSATLIATDIPNATATDTPIINGTMTNQTFLPLIQK